MTTRAWTHPDTGHTFITVAGDQIRIDALPPEGYHPAGYIGAGHPATPCPICRRLRGLTTACSDRHLFAHPVTGRARWRICGAGRLWHTLTPVYRRELTGWPNATTEHHSTGAAA
jgi:hypothetical protein